VSVAGAAAVLAGLAGCAEPEISESPYLYYNHFYTEARAVARPAALQCDSRNVILNNLRLGLASLAYGDLGEAESAMLRAYEQLIGGRVNPGGREAAATVGQEAVRVWTPEPYERAMAFYYAAAVYMVRGDWENARAGLRNALFALERFDIGEEGTVERETIESRFVLGYLLLGLAERLTGDTESARRALDRAAALRPDAAGLAETLKGGDFDTLLLVDYGRGPRKEAVGENRARIVFRPDGRRRPTPRVTAAVDGRGRALPMREPAVDLWVLSQFPKWWSLASWRRAKSAAGSFLTRAGIGAAVGGAAAESEKAVIAGAAAAATGALLQAGAPADDRHLAMLPRAVFLVPLTLGEGRHDVRVAFADDPLSSGTWHDLVGGSVDRPRVYSLRMHAANGRGMPEWSYAPRYYMEHTGVPEGTRHYLLGGRDVSAPADPQQRALFRREGIVFRPGDPNAGPNRPPDPDLYTHVTERGRVLWTPPPGTHGYQNITRLEHPPYRPRTEALRAARRSADPARPDED